MNQDNRKSKILLLCAVIIVAVLPLLFNISNLKDKFSSQDDAENIIYNDFIKNPANLKYILSSEYYTLAQEKTYRPVVTVSYFINYAFNKYNVVSWRLTNVIMHSINSALIILLVNLVIKNLPVAFLTGVLFAVNPIQFEIFETISFREDPQAVMFFLLSFIFFILKTKPSGSKTRGFYYPLSAFFFFLAVFTKESAAILPVLMFLYNIFEAESADKPFKNKLKNSFKVLYPYLAVLFSFIIISYFIFRPKGLIFGWTPGISTPYPGGTFFTSIINIPRTIFIHIMSWLIFSQAALLNLYLVFPYRLFKNLAINESLVRWGHIDGLESVFDVQFILPLVILLVLIYLLARNAKNKPVLYGLTFFVLSVIPVLGFPIPVGAVYALRYSYLPSIGLALIFAYATIKLYEKAKIPVIALLAVYLLVCANALLNINKLNSHATSLIINEASAQNDAKKVPQIYNLISGNYYFSGGNYPEALKYYKNALKNKPGDLYLILIVMDTAKTAGDYGTILDIFRNTNDARGFRTELAIYYNYVGEAFDRYKQVSTAFSLYNKSIDTFPFYKDPYFNLANIYGKLGDYNKAEQLMHALLKFDPTDIRAKKMIIFFEQIAESGKPADRAYRTEFLYQVSETMLNSGLPDKAEMVVQDIIKNEKKYPPKVRDLLKKIQSYKKKS